MKPEMLALINSKREMVSECCVVLIWKYCFIWTINQVDKEIRCILASVNIRHAFINIDKHKEQLSTNSTYQATFNNWKGSHADIFVCQIFTGNYFPLTLFPVKRVQNKHLSAFDCCLRKLVLAWLYQYHDMASMIRRNTFILEQ